jgi:hypothetical protein
MPSKCLPEKQRIRVLYHGEKCFAFTLSDLSDPAGRDGVFPWLRPRRAEIQEGNLSMLSNLLGLLKSNLILAEE